MSTIDVFGFTALHVTEWTTRNLWTILVVAIIAKVVSSGIYNAYFHPLSRFPGPKLAACSNVPYSMNFLGGRQPYEMLRLHRRYGPVVRVAPNELSFNTAQSFRDIYGFRPGHKTFVKSIFYEGGSFAAKGVHSIVSERDPAIHAQMRRLLSHAFSNSSLLEQEELVTDSVDRFVRLIRAKVGQRLDIADLFERMAFDIIGNLAFGETFGALEKDERHPWIAITMGALTKGALVDSFKRFPMLASIVKLIMHKQIATLIDDTNKNEELAIKLVERRVSRPSTRKDFLTRILEQRTRVDADPDYKHQHKVSDVELAAHVSDFVLAGSETTSTVLSTATYYLLKNPLVYKKLASEIRCAFESAEDINEATTRDLAYLNAVCKEAMRIYAPLPLGTPREVPEGGETVDGHFLPAGTVVATNPIAASLDPTNFADPLLFNPDRWLDDYRGQDDLEASQPFSLGARGCLGKSLGWMEMRQVLAKLIWNFDLELAESDLDWHRDSRMYTLWSKPHLHVRAKLADR
ncbi:putative cytochrome P450 [Annulohypoxylon maeteangense]|uniref:putative cytochrome P450 n=1 Tax=Annulohypoxylon maeteangense TaxID=1927788 RepID=UPI0020082470|nr:putative cytochrome P450 [Annulohypoxylon maeteangense]KAI0883029.1 putative cytochrome P450 [Annulohypoxylon maeteangense]